MVATPIGNLDDISKRALKVLEGVDEILCEDTRRSLILLERYGIKKKLVSYHKFKEKQLLNRILEELEGGKNLALISDAGTPCVNDPGQGLVEACLERGLGVSVIPGPCSVIQALVMSGFDTTRFQFVGFLPRSPGRVLRQAMGYPGTTVAFESPERLVETLGMIEGERKVAVVREMTKTFEECKRGRADEVREHYRKAGVKGEVVLVISAGKLPDDLSLQEIVEMLQNLHGLDLREAIKEAARLKDVPKRDIYKEFHRD